VDSFICRFDNPIYLDKVYLLQKKEQRRSALVISGAGSVVHLPYRGKAEKHTERSVWGNAMRLIGPLRAGRLVIAG
jgi:hypothetical protein